MLKFLLVAGLIAAAAPASAVVDITIFADVDYERRDYDSGVLETDSFTLTAKIFGPDWNNLWIEENGFVRSCSLINIGASEGPCIEAQHVGNKVIFTAPDLDYAYSSLGITLTFNEDVEANPRAVASWNFVSGYYSWSAGHHSGTVSLRGPVTHITAVPEPTTWGLMITGFAFSGGLMRRRPTTSALST